MSHPKVIIQMLGPFKIFRDGVKIQPADVGSRKARMLLQWLADARNSVVSHDVLLDALWPDQPEDRAMRSLRVRISELRKLLSSGSFPGELLARLDNGYMLRTVPGRLETDVDTFAALATEGLQTPSAAHALPLLKRSIALYKGDYLSDDPYTVQWYAARERYRNLFVAVPYRLAEIYESLGRYEDGIHLLQGLLAGSHADERLYRALIRLQYLNGDQGGALRTFQECREYLEAELGARPMPETLRLLKQVMRHESITVASSRPIDATPRPTQRHGKPAAGFKWPFLGRRAELARLQRKLAALQDGQGGIVWLHGPSGIGNTRLLREALAGAGQDRPFRTMWIQGSSLHSRIPFAGILDGLQVGLEPELTKEQTKLLMTSFSYELQQLTGWFTDLPRAGKRAAPSDPEPMKDLRLRQEMLMLFEHLARRMPLLCCIDDVHALDPASQALLVALARRTEKWPLLIVAVSRRGPQDSDVGNEMLHGDPPAAIIPLEPLSPAALQSLIGRGISSPWTQRWLRRLHTETGGEPLMVVATLDSLRRKNVIDIVDGKAVFPAGLLALITDAASTEAMPERLYGRQDEFQRRWNQLDDDARALLQKAAALRDSLTLQRLEQLANQPPHTFRSILEQLIRQAYFTMAGSPAEENTTLSFAQTRLRHRAYATMTRSERMWYHRQIFELLRGEGDAPDRHSAVGRARWSSTVALHARLAEEWEAAARWFLRAADDAKAITPGPEVVSLCRQALRAARRTTASMQGDLVNRARWALADALFQIGSYREAIPLYEALIDALGLDSQLIADRLVTMYLHDNRVEEADRLADRLLAQARDDDRTWGLANLNKAYVHYRSGEPAQAIARGKRALVHLRGAQYDEERAKAYQQLALFYWDMGEYGRAVTHAREGTALRRALGAPELVTSLNQLGELYQDLFCTRLALKAHREALDLARRDGRVVLSIEIWRNLGLNFVYEGRMAKGLKILERAWQQVQDFKLEPYWHEVHLRSLIEAKILAHQPAEVRALLKRYKDVTGPREAPFATMLSVGLAFLEGRVNDGARLLAQAGAFWQQTERRGRFFHVAVFAGQELMLKGYHQQAQRYLAMAMEELERICAMVPADVAQQIRASRQYLATQRLIRRESHLRESSSPSA